MKRYNATGLFVTVILALPFRIFAQGAPASIERLAWLSGCWERAGAGFSIQEQWMSPKGGMMVGMSRTVTGSRTLEYEYLRIEEQEGKLIYVAMPSGQTETSFTQIELTDSTVVFTNPDHDFPQHVSYRCLADGNILAQIDGDIGGDHKTVDFPLRRVPCE
ncbi:MAG: DUF6265 family protein [Candidatus Eisenbacteria bacterium]|jgi:hypothetical protein|nr:DUF6265 family protein [Candidatus Eisenbacteria bacterium]